MLWRKMITGICYAVVHWPEIIFYYRHKRFFITIVKHRNKYSISDNAIGRDVIKMAVMPYFIAMGIKSFFCQLNNFQLGGVFRKCGARLCFRRYF